MTLRTHPEDRVMRKPEPPPITDGYILSYKDERRRKDLEAERALDEHCRAVAELHMRWKFRL